jgi:hypothetical protein
MSIIVNNNNESKLFGNIEHSLSESNYLIVGTQLNNGNILEIINNIARQNLKVISNYGTELSRNFELIKLKISCIILNESIDNISDIIFRKIIYPFHNFW